MLNIMLNEYLLLLLLHVLISGLPAVRSGAIAVAHPRPSLRAKQNSRVFGFVTFCFIFCFYQAIGEYTYYSLHVLSEKNAFIVSWLGG